MDSMLVVVLDDREIDSVDSTFHASARETDHAAVGGNTRPDPLLSNDPDLIPSRTDGLSKFGCECRIATCIPEAALLLSERHFDVVLFDLDVFDGKTHRLISQLNDSPASLFSRLDIEGVCWWLPASITRKGHWGTATPWSMNSHLFFKELYRQLASGKRRNWSEDLAIVPHQLPNTRGPARGLRDGLLQVFSPIGRT
jgi:hypothetical protein